MLSPRWPWPLAVLLAAGGDVGVELPVLTGFQVGGAAVAGIGDQGIGPLTGVGLDPLQHGQQVHRIACLVAHPDRHDHLVVAIDGDLGVVALHPTVSGLEDLAIGIRKVSLCLGFGVAGCIGG